jgi:hypothetical protein
MSPLIPILGLGLLGYALSRRGASAPAGPPQLGGGFVRTIPIPGFELDPGTTWFINVLDTTALNSGAGIGRALQDAGWEPSGSFQQQGMIGPGNPFGAQGIVWTFPVTWNGPRTSVIELPVPLGTGLYIIDGNATQPPAPI